MNVEFNKNKPADYNYQPAKGSISNLIIKMGLAKDEKGTQKVMIAIIVLCFVLSLYFFAKALGLI